MWQEFPLHPCRRNYVWKPEEKREDHSHKLISSNLTSFEKG
jgi:hypothetical protein